MKTHLVFAIMTIALLAFVITQDQRKELNFQTVVGVASQLSREDFEPRAPIAEALRKLNYDQARDIRFREETTLWRSDGLPFQARFFFTAGAHNSDPVTIFQVNRDGAGPLRYDPAQFHFGPLVNDLSAADRAKGDYSGFRLYYPLNKPDQLDELIVFQGASYFRPLAKGLIYGLSARGIAIDPLSKEDFPAFTTFWLVQPARGATEMTIYALLEGRDVAGAYEFRIVPGGETRVHVRAALFARNRVKDVGLAPLTSMYWYGENTSNTFGDWRPEVHDSDGLQMQRSDGRWIWRPLAWARQRQVNVFADPNPKGFGLFQRDRDFTHYQDTEANYHQRPSIWVQPDGEWGAGAVVLMQNPTKDEYADNIVAYWRPDVGLLPGQRLDIAYTLVTFGDNPQLPPVARCTWTRIDYQDKANFRKVFLDFQGGELANLPPDARVEAGVWVGEGGIMSEFSGLAERIPNTNIFRVTFGVTSPEKGPPVEMLADVKLNGKTVSETWTYTWVK